MSPARIRSSVVFPAPFGPNTTSVSPAATVTSTPCSTRTAPYERRRPRAVRSGSPSGESIDTGAELLDPERLDDVAGVGQIEHAELRLDAHVRRRDDDWKVGNQVAKPAKQVDAVHVRQAHVQHGDIGGASGRGPHRLGTVGGEHEVVARTEVPLISRA